MDTEDSPIRHFQEMDMLTTTLKDLLAQVLDHDYSWESFGSWSLTIRYKGRRLRLTFDGKEGAYRLETLTTAQVPHSWSSIWYPCRSSPGFGHVSDYRCDSGSQCRGLVLEATRAQQ